MLRRGKKKTPETTALTVSETGLQPSKIAHVSEKLRPTKGYAHYFHFGLTSFLPVFVFILVQIELPLVALLIILLSKWRMFVVRPRFWIANLRANAVDILVSVALLGFMQLAITDTWRLIWAVVYAAWLLVIKPGSTPVWVAAQALLAQAFALSALYLAWGDAPLLVFVSATWAVCYLSARHFLTSYEEPYINLFASLWAYVGAALTWVLGHWLLFYGLVPQPVLILTVLGFGFGSLYYLSDQDKLSDFARRQILLIITAVIVVLLVGSNWGDRTL